MKKLEKYIISAAAAGIITIGCHTVTYADVSDTGTAVEETVSGPEETLSADMTRHDIGLCKCQHGYSQ